MSVDKTAAAAAKAKGNGCLTSGDFQGAIDAYTEAIGHDPTDKVFYSNRSAAYASMKNFDKALEDGNKCVELEPSFAKGYGRAGAALHGLGQYEEAVAIYNKGLEVDPSNAQLKQGLEAAKSAAAAVGANPIAQLFSNPENLQKLAMNPTTMAFLQQPDFVQKIQEIAQNPAKMNEHMKDERIMAALSVMMGMGGPGGPGDAAAEPAAPAPAPPPAPEPAPPPKELTEEEKEKLAIHEKAEVEKKAAAELYKQAGKLKKDPEAKAAKVKEALEGFTRAAEIEPTNMAYLNNRAACLFELKQYDECREECKKAVELGRSERADYQMIAKALARAGNCHFANEEYKEALDFYEQSLLEDHDDKVYRKKTDTKKKLKAAEAAAFLSPEKAEEEKEKGNEKFKEGDFHAALKHYTEAIARDPKNHKLYSNRCAAFQKIGQMPAALEDCEKCIAIDPTFVKIYNRKGSIQFFLKEYHKCTDTFQKVIDLEPESRDAEEAKQWIMKTQMAIRANQSAPADAEQQQRAMQDPEIQAIMADPMIRNVLNNFQENPKQAQEDMKDPSVAEKLNKLIAAGVLKTG